MKSLLPKYKRNYKDYVAEPHPQPLSDGEGRKKRTNTPLSIGEGLGVRFCVLCDLKLIIPITNYLINQ
jgi:hypothetical protein